MSHFKDIISALRCISTPGSKCREKCIYLVRESATLDAALLGIDEIDCCDVDRIGLDAADAIEQLVAERDDLMSLIYRCCHTCKYRDVSNGGVPCEPCTSCSSFCIDNDYRYTNWEWRGVQE